MQNKLRLSPFYFSFINKETVESTVVLSRGQIINLLKRPPIN